MNIDYTRNSKYVESESCGISKWTPLLTIARDVIGFHRPPSFTPRLAVVGLLPIGLLLTGAAFDFPSIVLWRS